METTTDTRPLRPIAGTALGERDPRAGFLVAGFGHRPVRWMDPFMNLDHFEMAEPTFRPHAHAGFSAVTVIFEGSPGSFRNRDSLGSDLTIEPGGTHWTRAGAGILHEEVPTVPGTVVHGAQIFVALPPELEQTDPLILHASPSATPTTTDDQGVRRRVLVGELDGATGIDPGHDVVLLDIALPAGARLQLDPGEERTAFAIAIAGSGEVNGQVLPDHGAVGFDPGPGLVALHASSGPVHVLVGGGTPLRRANHWIGGIAMSTAERSQAAADRSRRGELGVLEPSF